MQGCLKHAAAGEMAIIPCPAARPWPVFHSSFSGFGHAGRSREHVGPLGGICHGRVYTAAFRAPVMLK